ncbi:MAG: hypothetical protein ATN35_12440 [Epulopiscium sp. Nele67-Bin004]|nr:MAG: hypothetical protein ATN35_12440 [Epulopiscium sp. Nele67-Bin004]
MKMAVHNGSFHADDVFCVAMMQEIYSDLEVVRTRDEDILNSCDIVADVGNGEFDHHSADKKLREDGIPYCAFGLLWQRYGIDYIDSYISLCPEAQVVAIQQKIAYDFISQFDTNDNGIDTVTSSVPVMTLSKVIDTYIPFNATSEQLDTAFFEAVEFAKKILAYVVNKEINFYDNLAKIENLLNMQDVQQKRYLVLDKKVAWKNPLIQLDTQGHVLFVVYEDTNGNWMVQNVQKSSDTFEARKDLPASWAGLSGQALDKVANIEGCVFCHSARFLCGHKTKEGAIYLAELAVNE